jgi:WD40 repeat protein
MKRDYNIYQRKNMALALLSVFAMFMSIAASSQSIYNHKTPEVQHLWTRLADYSPVLRSVEAIEISPDGKSVISGSKFGYNLMMWRVADGSLMWEKQLPAEIECVAYSPDGDLVAAGDENYDVTIWASKAGTLIHTIESDAGFDGIAWSNTGKYIGGGSENGDLYLFDGKTFELIKRIECGSTINSLQFTKDDKKVLVCGNYQTPKANSNEMVYTGFAKLLDIETGKILQQYGGEHKASVKSVRMTADEKLLATGNFANEVSVFELETGEMAAKFNHPLKIEAVAFTPDGQFLAVGGHEKSITFYRVSDWELALEIPSPRVEYIDFSTDGRLMVTGHEDSGLIQLHLFLSDTQYKQELYHKLEAEQLNNKDLK